MRTTEFRAATRRGAVVSWHTHKRRSERCMKWRKMADHVQVSRGFMFLLLTVCSRAGRWGWTLIQMRWCRYGAGVQRQGMRWASERGTVGSKRKDEAACVDSWPAVIALACVSCWTERKQTLWWRAVPVCGVPSVCFSWWFTTTGMIACITCVFGGNKQ